MENIIPPELLPVLLELGDDDVLLPIKVKREDVNKLKGVKLTEDEVIKVNEFQAYLYDRGHIKENTFAAMFTYIYNLVFGYHRQAAEEEAKREKEEVAA